MEELERLLEEAHQAMDVGGWEEALSLAKEAEEIAPGNIDALFLQAEALLEGCDFNAAEGIYKRLDGIVPDEPAVLSGRGICLFELGRVQTAEQMLRLSLELDDRQPEVHHHLGLILERKEDLDGALKAFATARAQAPEIYLPPIQLADDEFDACIEDALDELPAKVQTALDNITVSVEDLPVNEDLLASDPPLSPQILGLWRGTPLSEKTVFDPWTEIPGGIVLYQKNLQRIAGDRNELVAQIRITVLHEVGHALGLTEADLDDRGLT